MFIEPLQRQGDTVPLRERRDTTSEDGTSAPAAQGGRHASFRTSGTRCTRSVNGPPKVAG